jgi:hypothetical protein
MEQKVGSIITWCKKVWKKYNPFDLPDLFNEFGIQLDSVKGSLDRIDKKISDEISFLEKEVNFSKNLVQAIGNTIPDMLWLKDLDGKYMYANGAIKCGLLMCDDPVGKDDVELATKAKEKYGADNHTFGEVCGNSDKVVIDELEPRRFLESGKIKGKMTYLEVYKAPFYVDDQLVGIVGTGRDMTEYVEAYRSNNCVDKCPNTQDIFSKYEFKNLDIG